MISDPLSYRIWRCLNVRHSSCLTRNTHKFSLIAIFFRYNYFAELGTKLIPLHFEIKLKNNLVDPAKSLFKIFCFENQSSKILANRKLCIYNRIFKLVYLRQSIQEWTKYILWKTAFKEIETI